MVPKKVQCVYIWPFFYLISVTSYYAWNTGVFDNIGNECWKSCQTHRNRVCCLIIQLGVFKKPSMLETFNRLPNLPLNLKQAGVSQLAFLIWLTDSICVSNRWCMMMKLKKFDANFHVWRMIGWCMIIK